MLVMVLAGDTGNISLGNQSGRVKLIIQLVFFLSHEVLDHWVARHVLEFYV